MPLYEYQCRQCGSRAEIFARRINGGITAPTCPQASGREAKAHAMERIVSKFQRHLTEADKIAEAEAKFGKEVDAAMGPTPDIAKYARRYEKLAKNLPKKEDL